MWDAIFATKQFEQSFQTTTFRSGDKVSVMSIRIKSAQCAKTFETNTWDYSLAMGCKKSNIYCAKSKLNCHKTEIRKKYFKTRQTTESIMMSVQFNAVNSL